LEEAGLVASEVHRGATVGRPQVLFAALDREGREGRDYRLLGEILASLLTNARQRDRAETIAREWGAYLVGRSVPRPGARGPSGPNLAVLQEALAEAGFDPRFRRRSAKTVEISLRDCPFRDLLEEHRELVCAVHKGLLEGMLGASRPSLRMTEFEPLVERSAVCRLVARGA
jgi:predicted ArsR family transcriptional regulator